MLEWFQGEAVGDRSYHMAIKRTPNSILVNGAYFQVKDPSAAAGTLFADYVTVPGLASFTLPSETGSTTDTALMDGSIAAANFKGVGTIVAAIGARAAHPAHQFLEAAALSGKQVQIRVVRAATGVTDIREIASGTALGALAAKGVSAIGAGLPKGIAKANALAGHIVHLWADNSVADDGPAHTGRFVVGYGAAVTAALSKEFQLIASLGTEGDSVKVAPGYLAAVAVAATKKGQITIRNPGLEWKDLVCTVSQFDSGDLQAGSHATSNLTLVPASAVPVPTIISTLEDELKIAA